MSVVLDLADIQGNILAGYGKQGFPVGRLILFHVDGAGADAHGANGRRFVDMLRPRVTNALRWDDDKPRKPNEFIVPKPLVALNLAFSFHGLIALGVPTRTLREMPDPFIDGMAARARLLGDDFAGAGWRDKWDEVWRPSHPDPACDPKTPHILVTLNAQLGDEAKAEMEKITAEIIEAAAGCGVKLLPGHNRSGDKPQPYQELSALFTKEGKPRNTEHFGFADGISDPVFDGQYLFGEERLEARGNGAVDGEDNWRPLATGEFLLGYPDEAQENAGPITPIPFFRNGTYMAYRKLHQNVRAWNDFIDKTARDLQKVFKIADFADARELLVAKMIGRWSDGVPLSVAPTLPQWKILREEIKTKRSGTPQERAEARKALIDFRYFEDPKGLQCPLASHTRRVNTRDSLDPRGDQRQEPALRGGSVLNNRRRILRRGLPYGKSGPDSRDEEEHGIVMLVLCADLFRQFEFVQQQWVNYGLDARSGGDTCPIVGNHSQGDATMDDEARKRNGPKAKFVIPADPRDGHPPFIVEGLPQFVETRGGEYFFVPSLTSLRMIAKGSVDPT